MSIIDKAIAAAPPPVSDQKRAEAHEKARAAATPGDWLSMILDHHEGLAAAFEQLKAANGADARRAAQKKLGILLNGHAISEEAVIYPALARAGKILVAEIAYNDQSVVKMFLAALEHLDPISQEYLDKVTHLEVGVETHIYLEESHWFLDLKEKASPDDQHLATERYREEYNRYIDGDHGSATRFPD